MKREIRPIPLVSERRHRSELLRKAFPPLILGIITVVVVTLPARALLFNVSYDASVANAPAAFQSAFQNAISFYQSTYTDPITINIDVGWGEIDGNPLTPGNLGQSRTNQPGNFSYSQVRSALISDAKSAADFQAVSTLRAADPTGGRAFSYTFDPSNRAVAGDFDFIGVAEHEIAEVMGRYGMTQNGCGTTLCDSPIDLFRYTSPRNSDLNPENGSYFSIDSGDTNINTFNGTGGGDLSDWLGLTTDAFNHALMRGQEEPVTEGDLILMDVIGYDPAVVPEPGTLALLATSLIGLGALRWRSPEAGTKHLHRAPR